MIAKDRKLLLQILIDPRWYYSSPDPEKIARGMMFLWPDGKWRSWYSTDIIKEN